MTRKFEHFQNAAAWFVLGSLRGREKSTFESHVQRGCAACEQDLRELANVVEDISLAAPATEPSIRVRQRLLDSLAGDSFAGDSFSRNSFAGNSPSRNSGAGGRASEK